MLKQLHGIERQKVVDKNDPSLLNLDSMTFIVKHAFNGNWYDGNRGTFCNGVQTSKSVSIGTPKPIIIVHALPVDRSSTVSQVRFLFITSQGAVLTYGRVEQVY